MKYLADENLHGDIVAWLRGRGHDVVYAAESFSAESDEELLSRARAEGRTVITNDKDFGELIFHRRLAPAGVILIRLYAPIIADRIARLDVAWRRVETQSSGSFIVVTQRKIRVRLPKEI